MYIQNVYSYAFIHFRIDGTQNAFRLARYVNHSCNGTQTLTPEYLEVDGRPHILMVAAMKLMPGTVLSYNYGEWSLAAQRELSWLDRRKGI